MIDTDTIEKYILGGEWENQYPQVIEELLAEVKRLREALSEIDEDFFSYLKDVRPNDSLTRILQEMKE